jgi:integrase
MHSTTEAPIAGATTTSSVIAGDPKSLTVGQLIDAYMSEYAGRDRSRLYRLAEWHAKLGDRVACTLTDDDVFHTLEAIGAAPARHYAGRDADGRPIHRARKEKRSPATVNRYHAALAAVYTWAIKKRRLPKGTVHPCRQIEGAQEPAGVVRFLSDEERNRLLEACRRSAWPPLYALVLMAITTGARRGELERVTWGDIDFERNVAHVRAHAPGEHVSKNGDARVLPLVAPVIEALQALKPGAPSRLVFASSRRPTSAYRSFKPWRAALKAAGVRNFRFHDLRHSCASYLAQSGASILEIGDVLGHRSLRMTQRYSHLTVQSKARLVNSVLGAIR